MAYGGFQPSGFQPSGYQVAKSRPTPQFFDIYTGGYSRRRRKKKDEQDEDAQQEEAAQEAEAQIEAVSQPKPKQRPIRFVKLPAIDTTSHLMAEGVQRAKKNRQQEDEELLLMY